MTDAIATRRGVLVGAALAAAQPGGTPAPSAIAGFAAAAARANTGTVGIVSGGVDGTYIRIAADLAAVLDDSERLRILPIVGKGSVQNLADIIYVRGIDLGIVQSDALAFVVRENSLPGVGQAVSYLAKLYDEEVHILAGADVAKIEDLAGKPVNVDGRGSGTAMTAQLIFAKLNIPIQPTYDSQDVALQRLRAGAIAAMVYVAGKPARLFTALGPDPLLHFVAIPPSAELLGAYLPAQLGAAVYPGLVPEGPPVETIAVGAVLAAYGWRPGTERHARVMQFLKGLTAKFAELQKPPRHPKWRDVNLSAQVPGWTRFDTAEPGPAQSRARRPSFVR